MGQMGADYLAGREAGAEVEAEADGAAISVGGLALRSFGYSSAVGAAAPALPLFDFAESVAALAASATVDAAPSVWPSSALEGFVYPRTMGVSSIAAVASCMAATPCLMSSEPLARAIHRLNCARFSNVGGALASSSGGGAPQQWQEALVESVAGAEAETVTFLSSFGPTDFHPTPLAAHAFFVALDSLCCDGAGGGPGGEALGAGAAAAGSEMAEEGGAVLPHKWYGGYLSVPPAATSMEALEALCGVGWSGLVLCLATPTHAHYVAFCRVANVWHFFDPDEGVVALPPSSPLPAAIFSSVLLRTLYRFRLPVSATAVVPSNIVRHLVPLPDPEA